MPYPHIQLHQQRVQSYVSDLVSILCCVLHEVKIFIFIAWVYLQQLKMEQRLSSNLSLFLGAVRRRLNQRKISLEDFMNECNFKNKSKISIFEFAIIVQRINCGTSFFKARDLFAQVEHRGDYLSMENFRNLFLKVSKIPLSDLEISMHKSEVKNNSKTLIKQKKVVKTEGDELLNKIKKQHSYYSEIGFNKLTQFVSHKHQKPEKIFNDCDLNRSGFIDRSQFNKFLVASEIFQFKDKDVRRYLISDVFDKLKAQKISKAQFFQIFSYKPIKPILKPTAKLVPNTITLRPSPNISIKKIGKSSEKKLDKIDPVRTKIMSHSITVKQQTKNLPDVNQRGGRRRMKDIRHQDIYDDYGQGGYDDYGDTYGGQEDYYDDYGGRGGRGGRGGGKGYQGENYYDQDYDDYPYGKQKRGKNSPYQRFMGRGIQLEFVDEEDIDPYNDPRQGLKGYQDWYGPNVFIEVEPGEPGKIGPLIPVKPLPKGPKPYYNPQIQPQYPDDPYPRPPVEPNYPNPVQPRPQPIQPNQPVVYKKASQYYRFGVPKNKDLEYFKQFQQLLNNKTPFRDNQNPVIDPKFKYKPAVQIFKSMGLLGNNQMYSLFAESDQSRNQNRNEKEFSKLIQADDIRQGEVGDCYYLCAIASVAYDYPEIMAEKFLFEVNPVNYYVAKLFIDGEWKYFKTDDQYAASFNNTGYCHPREAQIWVMLIEKAFAKTFGNYSAIDAGTQTQSFFVLTGAVSEFIQFQTKNNQEIKKAIIDADKKGYLMATAGSNRMLQYGEAYLQQIGLVGRHAYSLLAAVQVGNQLLIKLRNPWGKTVYKGDWSFNSNKWTPQLRRQLNFQKNIQNGTFYMSWQDYIKYYGGVTICKIHPTFVHTSFKMTNNSRKSNYIEVKVPTKGQYHFFICQQSSRKYKLSGKNYQYSDARIILVKKNQNGKYEYIAAKCTPGAYQSQMCCIETQLEVGTYLISAKVKWTNGWQNHDCFLVSYGVQNVAFQLADRSCANKFKSDMVASYAIANSPKAEKKDYRAYGINGLTSQSHFSTETGMGYVRLVNRANRQYTANLNFMLAMQIKVIKPNTVNWNPTLRPNEEAVIGFFINGSFSYSIQQSFY